MWILAGRVVRASQDFDTDTVVKRKAETMPDSTDYYPGDSEEGSPPPKPEEQETDSNTALIPKTLLAGKDFNPGDEVVFKIVAMHGEEVEIQYATEDKPEKKPTAMDEAMDSMGEMASKE